MALSILMKAKQVGVSTTVVAIYDDIVAIYDDSLGNKKEMSAFIYVTQNHLCLFV
jgi:hypothetical protein